MMNLLKFAIFCLIFLSFSQVGFSQVDTVDFSPDYLKGFGFKYADSTYFENITFLKSKVTPTKKTSKIKNNVTVEKFNLTEDLSHFPEGKPKMFEFINKKMRYQVKHFTAGRVEQCL